MIINMNEVINAICKNNGVENKGYSLKEAKEICGVSEIIMHKGIPVKESVCNYWFDGECGDTSCRTYDAFMQECEDDGVTIEALGGTG